jgi:hypothetical protein
VHPGDARPATSLVVSLMGRPCSSALPAPPPCYVEIENALILFAVGREPAELHGALALIDHPAAWHAADLPRVGQRGAAEHYLDQVLEQMAGPPNGDGLR